MALAESLVEAIREEFPGFRIVEKRSDRLSKLIDRALKLITLGGQREYLTHYHTVLGNTLYVPDVWAELNDVEQAVVLRHERVHLRQRRRFTFPIFAFLYLIPFLPLGLAYGRAKLEWEAYAETLRATADYEGKEAALSPDLRRKIVGRFTGGAYGWMWPFRGRVNRWYDQVIAEIVARRPSDEPATAPDLMQEHA